MVKRIEDVIGCPGLFSRKGGPERMTLENSEAKEGILESINQEYQDWRDQMLRFRAPGERFVCSGIEMTVLRVEAGYAGMYVGGPPRLVAGYQSGHGSFEVQGFGIADLEALKAENCEEAEIMRSERLRRIKEGDE